MGKDHTGFKRLRRWLAVMLALIAGLLSLTGLLRAAEAHRRDAKLLAVEPATDSLASYRHVATNGVDDGNDCANPVTPCASVQHAVDVAQPFDVIKVAAGTYSGVASRPAPAGYPGPSVVTQVVYLSKTVTIQGGYPPTLMGTAWITSDPQVNPTILDGGRQGRVFYIAGLVSPTIEGLCITGGDAKGLGGPIDAWGFVDAGGGTYVISASITFSANAVISNVADMGGGAYLVGSDKVTFSHNTVSNNQANEGGGLFLQQVSSATLVANIVTANTAWQGGGLDLYGSNAVLDGNTISTNIADVVAGGLYLQGGQVTLRANTIVSNSSDEGGGATLWDSTAVFTGNVISHNSSGGQGGGMALRGGLIMLAGNTVSHNDAGSWGGGLLIEEGYGNSATLEENIISHNIGEGPGGGVCAFVPITLTSNAVMFNTATGGSGHGGGLFLAGDTTVLSGNVVASNTATHVGGGMFIDSNATLSNNTIVSNTSGGDAGGLLLAGKVTSNGDILISNTARTAGGGLIYADSDTTLINTVVAANRADTSGSGLIAWGPLRLLHATIAHNYGGDSSGIVVGYEETPATLALTNTIIAGHATGISVTAGSAVTLHGVLWSGVPITISRSPTAHVTVQNEHWGHPAFVDPGRGNYHIRPTSAAVDRGVDAGVRIDIDGQPRPAGPGYDLGADEVANPVYLVYLPLAMRDN